MIPAATLQLQLSGKAAFDLPLLRDYLDYPEIVYVIRIYSLQLGSDIAIWMQGPTRNWYRRTYATGAIVWKDAERLARILTHVEQGAQDSLSARIQNAIRVESELSPPPDCVPRIAEKCSPLINTFIPIAESEFELASSLAERAKLGCTATLGVSDSVRIVTVQNRTLVIDANTETGTGEGELTWSIINEMLRNSHLLNVPSQTIDISERADKLSGD